MLATHVGIHNIQLKLVSAQLLFSLYSNYRYPPRYHCCLRRDIPHSGSGLPDLVIGGLPRGEVPSGWPPLPASAVTADPPQPSPHDLSQTVNQSIFLGTTLAAPKGSAASRPRVAGSHLSIRPVASAGSRSMCAPNAFGSHRSTTAESRHYSPIPGMRANREPRSAGALFSCAAHRGALESESPVIALNY